MSKAAYPLELPASIKAELDRAAIPLRERFARLRRAHPLPPPTGRAADKAFFDELSGQS
jgi:antitoxin VapB